MFSKSIVRTDSFIEMPAGSQNLYFHLGMEADDEGFVNPRMIMKTLGSTDDEFKLLIAKGFVIPFESGVIVLRHWKENNYLQSDRLKPTLYSKEKDTLSLDRNNVYNLYTQYRVEEDRLLREPEVRIETISNKEDTEKVPKSSAKYPHAKEVFALWGDYPRAWESLKNVRQREAAENIYHDLGVDEIKSCVEFLEKHKDEKYCPQIFSPYDLQEKYKSLEAFSNKKYAS